MGNTTWFANAGYKTLWIAHWNVSAPTVPAANWGGKGWTFWQWTSCGHVTGITGCVDRDRYNGSNLSPVTIR
jgi:GH25 family lysozyme M1 (1,4-beta-N-acetylmuramidase)